MLLSLDRPSPAAAAAALLLLLLLLDAVAGGDDDEVVAVTGPPPSLVSVNVKEPSVAVPLAGASMRVTVKFAGIVVDAEVLGRTQVVVGVVEVHSVACVAWAACWSGLCFVSCARARVVAPRAARMWEGRIGWWMWIGRADSKRQAER